jgi:hypothetical protein
MAPEGAELNACGWPPGSGRSRAEGRDPSEGSGSRGVHGRASTRSEGGPMPPEARVVKARFAFVDALREGPS